MSLQHSILNQLRENLHNNSLANRFSREFNNSKGKNLNVWDHFQFIKTKVSSYKSGNKTYLETTIFFEDASAIFIIQTGVNGKNRIRTCVIA